jgi:DNA-binding PadR family transcriptional regulator
MGMTTIDNQIAELQGTVLQAQTRLLLALWDMGGSDVKKGELMSRVVRSKEKTSSYQPILSRLEKEQAIAISGKRTQTISLSDKGLELLDNGLRNAEFMFDSSIGAKTANALLKWIQASKLEVSVAETNDKSSNGKVEVAISSYDEFKSVALEVYDRLDRDYNLDNLVPIYRIRREIGERVARAQFNNWMLDMQANDVFQLIGGEMPSLTPDKAEDSIKTDLGGERYYAKRLYAH